MSKKKRTSLENAFEILKLFSLNEPELSVTEVAERLDISKSTAHRLLSSLLAEEFIYQSPKNQLYSLGSSILALVNIVNSQIHISSESIPILNTIAEQTRESAHLSIREDPNTVVYIQTVKGNYPENSKTKIQLGSRREITATACGKVFMAFDADIRKEHEAAHQLLDDLLAVKKEGYSMVELNSTTEVAVPVFYNGQITASLSITARSSRIRSERLRKQAIRYLKLGAEKLEKIIANRKKGDRIERICS